MTDLGRHRDIASSKVHVQQIKMPQGRRGVLEGAFLLALAREDALHALMYPGICRGWGVSSIDWLKNWAMVMLDLIVRINRCVFEKPVRCMVI